jgi:hypothetical protein
MQDFYENVKFCCEKKMSLYVCDCVSMLYVYNKITWHIVNRIYTLPCVSCRALSLYAVYTHCRVYRVARCHYTPYIHTAVCIVLRAVIIRRIYTRPCVFTFQNVSNKNYAAKNSLFSKTVGD